MLIRPVVLSLGLLLRFGFLSVLKGLFPTLPVVFTCLFFTMIKLLHQNKYIYNVKALKPFVKFDCSLSYILKQFCEVRKCNA